MKWEKTSRGFVIGTFSDLYGLECEVQESSLATDNAIWLGVSDAKPQIMASDAHKFGIETDQTTGWVDYPIPSEVLLHTRMHLNRAQAQDLINALQIFVDTGYLEGDEGDA
jgi:hypothetical protein